MGSLGRYARAGLHLATALAVLALAGCASTPGQSSVSHIVRPGENLYRISRFYGVDLRKVIRANRIRDVTNLSVGQEIFIPGATRKQPGHALVPGPGGHVPKTSGGRELALREADLHFVWPVSGELSSGFGWRSGRRHEGLDIRAKRGTPVRVAEAGRVILQRPARRLRQRRDRETRRPLLHCLRPQPQEPGAQGRHSWRRVR